METTSRRSWLSAALLALVTPWWPRAAAAEPPAGEEEIRSYSYDVPGGEIESETIYTYDRFNLLTQVQHIGPLPSWEREY